MKKLFTLIGAGLVGISSLYSQCSDLFFSEYIEGSSFNKAIEIYNPTSGSIDLSNYELRRYNNGSGSANGTLTLSGTLNAGATYTICHTSADPALQGAADLQDNIVNYNGDDAFELYNTSSGTAIDIIGVINEDPGSSWPVGSGSTVNSTLVRMASVNQGSTNWTTGATEWDVYASDEFSYFGSHTMTPCTPPSSPEVQFSSAMANVDEDGTSITITVNIAGEDGNPTAADIVLLGTGTAVEGTDFTYASTATVTFPANDNTAQTISIPITDNALTDGDLTFVLELQNLTNSATTGTNSQLTVTIVDDEVPYYTIDQIDDLDADGVTVNDGLEVNLSGYVYGVNLRPTGLQFTLHDGTGGIGVINFTGSLGYTVTEGDSIDVIGEIDQYNGLLQVAVTEVNLHSQGHILPAPTVVTALDESTESELIQLNNVYISNIADWSPGGAGFNADVTDGTNTFTMRIDSDIDLHAMMAPDGTFDLIGIGGQFDSSSPYDEGYQLLPRYNNDVQIKPVIVGGDQTICPGDTIMVDFINVTYDWAGTNATTQKVVADTAGTYSVDVTYGTVTATASVVITLTTDIPDAGFTVSDITICNNVDITVTDTSINANSISIDFGDGNNTTTSPAINQYTTDGIYTISLAATSAFGCVDSATVQITVNDCASIDENEKISLNVYPNPSNGLSQISTDVQGVYEIKVLDLTGQIVKTIRTADQNIDLNMTDHPAGIYFVNLTSSRQTNTVKLIVK